jgi:hypothetical protein
MLLITRYIEVKTESFARVQATKAFIQGVSKMLGKTSKVSYSHQNIEKERSYEQPSGKKWFLSFTERLHSTITTHSQNILHRNQWKDVHA